MIRRSLSEPKDLGSFDFDFECCDCGFQRRFSTPKNAQLNTDSLFCLQLQDLVPSRTVNASTMTTGEIMPQQEEEEEANYNNSDESSHCESTDEHLPSTPPPPPTRRCFHEETFFGSYQESRDISTLQPTNNPSNIDKLVERLIELSEEAEEEVQSLGASFRDRDLNLNFGQFLSVLDNHFSIPSSTHNINRRRKLGTSEKINFIFSVCDQYLRRIGQYCDRTFNQFFDFTLSYVQLRFNPDHSEINVSQSDDSAEASTSNPTSLSASLESGYLSHTAQISFHYDSESDLRRRINSDQASNPARRSRLHTMSSVESDIDDGSLFHIDEDLPFQLDDQPDQTPSASASSQSPFARPSTSTRRLSLQPSMFSELEASLPSLAQSLPAQDNIVTATSLVLLMIYGHSKKK